MALRHFQQWRYELKLSMASSGDKVTNSVNVYFVGNIIEANGKF